MAQHAIHALALGCLYALFATGLVFLSRAQRSWHLAYGGLHLIGAYAAWWTLRSSYPVWMALVLAPLCCALCALALIGVERLARRPRSERAQLLWGLGLLLCSMELCRFMMGPHHRKLLAIDSRQIYHMGPLMLTDMHWLLFGCAFGCGVCLHGLMTTSRAGAALQTLLRGREAPASQRIVEPSWFAAAIGACLAGLGGSLAALHLNDAHPELGLRAMHKLLCVVMIGGLGHVRGAVLAAFALAGLEGLIAPMTIELPLPVESYLLVALVAASGWRRPSTRRTTPFPTGRRQATMDAA